MKLLKQDIRAQIELVQLEYERDEALIRANADCTDVRCIFTNYAQSLVREQVIPTCSATLLCPLSTNVDLSYIIKHSPFPWHPLMRLQSQ